MIFCSHCGAALAPNARFCSRCGKEVVSALPPEPKAATPVPVPPPRPEPVTPRPAPASAPAASRPTPVPPVTGAPPAPGAARTTTPPPRPQQQQGGGKWWIVPAVIVGLVLLAFLALMGLPFGRDEGERRAIAVDETETIAEGTAGSTQTPTATILEVPGEDLPVTSTVAPPPVIQPGDPVPVPGTATPPAPAPTATVPPTTTTAAVPPSTTSAEPPRGATRVTESEAQGRLRSYITSRNVYPDVARSCLQIRSDGYKNEGYGFSVWQACISGGGAKRVGMWRVDAKDGSLYRRNDRGRYVSP